MLKTMIGERVMKTEGSALTECIVLMLVMLPLVAGIPMIGKLTDLKQTSINAGRYAAWEETISPNKAPSRLINQRFFKNEQAELSTNSMLLDENSLWGAGRSETSGLLSATTIRLNRDSAGSAVVDVSAPAIVKSLGLGIEKAGEVLSGFSGTQWDITGEGFRRAEVSASIDVNSWLEPLVQRCRSDQAICIHSSNTIMVDGWSSSGDEHSARRVRSLVPSTVLKPVGKVLSQLGKLPPLKELRPIDRSFGYVNMEALPVGTRSSLPNYRSAQ